MGAFISVLLGRFHSVVVFYSHLLVCVGASSVVEECVGETKVLAVP